MRFIKEAVGLILIIVFVITIEIITEKVTKDSLKILEDKISIIQKHKTDEELKKSVKDLSETWNEEERKLSCYMEHNELEEITKLINFLEFDIENNKNENINEKIDEIEFKMDHIENKQKLKIENIF